MSEERNYTPQDVVNQSLVAFGQGTGCLRVNSRACRVLAQQISEIDRHSKMHESWGIEAVQVLERVRVAGRLAGARTVEDGRTCVEADDVRVALRKVMKKSGSDRCPPVSTTGAGTGSYPP